MAGNLFDVFVVGSTDPSAAGETRLAAALSAKHGLPLATVAKAISAKNLRAGQSLDQAQAPALVRHLQAIGAVPVIRSAMRPPGQSGQPSQIASAPVAQPSPMPATSPSRLQPPTPPPGSGWPGAGPSLGSTPSPVATGTVFGMPSPTPHSPADPFAPIVSAQPNVQAGAPDPFQPRHVPTPSISGRSTAAKMPTPSPVQSQPSASGLALDRGPSPKMELARQDLTASGEPSSIAPGRPSTSELSLREIGMKSKSGVAMDEDPRNLNLVRCVQHGLYYDKSKASGCRKCMASAREVVSKMEAQATVFRLGDFRRKPAQRAFVGLAFALVLGFLPAVYYCFGPGTTEARKLRVEQELLSRQPGTEEIMHHFDELNAEVSDSHHQATRNTAIVWVAVTSMAMLGWYRIT